MYFRTLVLISSVVQCFSSNNPIGFPPHKILTECALSTTKLSCLANKTAKIIERAMDWDITLFDGIKFLRNKEKLHRKSEPRSGFSRLSTAFTNFINTHYFSVDLTEDDHGEARIGGEGEGGGGDSGFGGGGGFGGFGGYSGLKKEKKFAQYAFMVLLGIFGLTGPLVMKTLAVMAAKALIASKMALIIVGSVALKKIFEKDHEKTSVKVHTIGGDDEHDRIYAPSKATSSSWYYNPYIKPT